jgi:hypothetical protein
VRLFTISERSSNYRMCVKTNAVRRLYIVVSQTQVAKVVKQYPLYRQIYEDTKNTTLNENQLAQFGLQPNTATKYRMMQVEVPTAFLL